MATLNGKQKTLLRKNLYNILQKANNAKLAQPERIEALVEAIQLLAAKLDASPDISDTDYHEITDDL